MGDRAHNRVIKIFKSNNCTWQHSVDSFSRPLRTSRQAYPGFQLLTLVFRSDSNFGVGAAHVGTVSIRPAPAHISYTCSTAIGLGDIRYWEARYSQSIGDGYCRKYSHGCLCSCETTLEIHSYNYLLLPLSGVLLHLRCITGVEKLSTPLLNPKSIEHPSECFAL